MKKIYFLAASLLVGTVSNAQIVDTLTSHFGGTPTIYTASGGGYVGGNNSYDDLAKMQMFDASYGVVGAGTISKVLLQIPIKTQNGAGAGTFEVNIWADNAGEPGTELGSVTMTMASVDTSFAAFDVADGAVVYNVIASFSSAIAIPSSQKFWAGVQLPTGANDTIALATTTDGDFTDASTHTGEWWSDGSYHSFAETGNWELDIALAIFPIITLTSVTEVVENEMVVSVYPNPTTGAMNMTFGNNETSYVIVRDLSGRTVSKVDVNGAASVQTDFSELAAGTYVCETISFDGELTSKVKFVKQ